MLVEAFSKVIFGNFLGIPIERVFPAHFTIGTQTKNCLQNTSTRTPQTRN